MDNTTRRVIEHCSNALNYSNHALIDAIEKLREVGVDSCHVDYQIPELTFYSNDGDYYSLPLPLPEAQRSSHFAKQELCSIISNLDGQSFCRFKTRTLNAGCVSVVLWLAAGHVTCFGPRGEILDECLQG